jgi:hypothetical protein
MQLKKPKTIRGALATATCALLGTNMPQPAAAALDDWQLNSAILLYSEKDRVSAVEPVVRVRRDLGDDEFLNFKFTVDVLSGSSPNGAVPSDVPQTFSGPSGESSYTVNPGDTPLDPTFRDERFAASVLWEKPRSRNLRTVFGGNFSTETDYLSLGGSATLLYDVNNKNTTLSAGAAFNLDNVSPIGGAPTGLTNVSDTVGGESEGDGGGETKTVTDLLFGVTQVVSRQTLMQFNYGIGTSSGYLTDPYKLLSVVQSDGSLAPETFGSSAYKYFHEKRPDSRKRQSLYWKMNHQFTDDVLYLSYRYYWDDWDIKSHTVDARYRFEFGKHQFIEPHARFYRQTSANFYRYFLLEGDALPQYASADYRLGDLTTTTLGVKYGIELDKNSEFSFRIESMKQSGESHPAQAVGILKNYDLFPDVNAIILQASYNYKF